MSHPRLRAGLAIAAMLTVSAAVRAQAPQPLVVTSPTLKAGEPVPTIHTADGKNISPALSWTGAPPTTKEFAVICEDPDVSPTAPFVHWVVYKIPASASGLPADLPIDSATPMPQEIAGAVQGLSGFKRPLYRGPAPPAGKVHHYHFIVYALDAPIEVRGTASKVELIEAMKGHVVGQGELVATYERK